MKIGIAKLEPGRFALTFDAKIIEVNEHDLKTLWMRIEEAIQPEERDKRAERYKSFLAHLSSASDAGIQTLLRTAAHDDILVLLHSSEDNDRLKKKLYRNMSQNSMKMYIEDLLFEFREGVPGYRFDGAMVRLIETVEKMVSAGTISFPRDAR
jgi:flagellar motor switch protein FliG